MKSAALEGCLLQYPSVTVLSYCSVQRKGFWRQKQIPYQAITSEESSAKTVSTDVTSSHGFSTIPWPKRGLINSICWTSDQIDRKKNRKKNPKYKEWPRGEVRRFSEKLRVLRFLRPVGGTKLLEERDRQSERLLLRLHWQTHWLENPLLSWQSLFQGSSSSLCWQALDQRNGSPALCYLPAALSFWAPSLSLQDDQLHCGARQCWANGRFVTVAIKRIGKGKRAFFKAIRIPCLKSW